MIQLECDNRFVMSLQHTDLVKGLPFQELLRRTSNNYGDGDGDGDGNGDENVKKKQQV